MANEIIRPSALETERTSPVASEFLVTDNETSVAKVTIEKAVQAGRPAASKSEAEAGSDANKVMTPLNVQQKLDYEIGRSLASKAQGDKADTAVQPSDLGAVATSNDYDDLDNKPTLGTAASENVEAFATAEQGGKADTAIQSVVEGSGIGVDLTDPQNPVISYTGTDGVSDGDKGDVTVSGSGATWELNPEVVTDAKVAAGADIDAVKLLYYPQGAGTFSRTVANKLGDVLSFGDFDPTGDGVDDEADKMNDAVAAAIAVGKTLFIPAPDNVYRLADTVSNDLQAGPLHILGDGEPILSSYGQNRGACFKADFVSSRHMFDFGADGQFVANRLLIERIGALAVDTQVNYLINVVDVGGLRIRGCNLAGSNRAINAKRGFVARITDNFIQGTFGPGIRLEEKAINSGCVSRNGLFNCGNAYETAAIDISQGDNATIHENNIEGCYGGFQLGGTASASVMGNYIEGGTYLFYLSDNARATNIHGNWFGESSAVTTIENCEGGGMHHNAVYNATIVQGATAVDFDMFENTVLGTASVAGPRWNNLTLVNSWEPASSWLTPSYRMDFNGNVRLRGGAVGGATNTILSSLPQKYRPSGNIAVPVATPNLSPFVANVIIESDGDIVPQQSSAGMLTLDGISYRP